MDGRSRLERKYRNYERFVQRALYLSGLALITKNYNRKFFSSHLPILASVFCLSMLYGFVNFSRLHISNLPLLTRCLSVFGSYVMTLLKVKLKKSRVFVGVLALEWLFQLFLVYVYREDFRRMDSILGDLFEASFSKPEVKPVMLSLLYNFYHPAYMHAVLVTSLSIIYLLAVPLDLIVQVAKHVKKKRCFLPYPVSYPWAIEGCGLVYQIHYWSGSISIWFTTFVTISVDILFGYYTQQIAAILKAMSFEIQQVHVQAEYSEKLKDMISRHNRLLRCRNILQAIYGPIVLGMALTSAIIMCALIFQGFKTSMTVVKIVLSVTYMFMKMSQTFMYSWYGTIITLESENFRMAVYNSMWYKLGSSAMQRNIVIVLLQKSIVLVAAKFFNITVDLFIGILNTTISYFFLLQSLDTR